MRVRLQADPTHALQRGAEAGVAREIAAQRQGVEEAPDHPGQLGPGAPADRRADHQVILAGQPVQQGLEARQQSHKQCRAGLAAQRPQRGDQRPVEHQRLLPAVEGLLRRTRAIGGQLQRRRDVAQLPAPVVKLAGAPLGRVAQPGPLPERVVGVLERRRGQGRRTPFHLGRVAQPQFARDDAHRPAVGDQVVQGQQQRMFGFVRVQQRRPQQRAALQVERPTQLLGRPGRDCRRALALGQVPQIHQWQL